MGFRFHRFGKTCADELAAMFRKVSLHKFEAPGGLVSGTESSRGRISLQRPNRQWECVLFSASRGLSAVAEPFRLAATLQHG